MMILNGLIKWEHIENHGHVWSIMVIHKKITGRQWENHGNNMLIIVNNGNDA